MLYLGIDIGTSSAKLTLINEYGKIVKEVSGNYKVLEPKPGWKEIDPEQWMNVVEQKIDELFKQYDSYEVEAIGITGQMHTIIMLDEQFSVIRPALMWNDIRTQDMIADIKEKMKMNLKTVHLSKIISTGSPLSNLLWVKKYEKGNFQKIYKFLIGPDYITFRLTGNVQTDFCEASTSSLLDFENKGWSKEIQKMFDLPSSIYPEIKGSMEIAGTITEQWANKFRMRKDVKILTGTGDNPAAAIATGCFSKHYPVLSIGTSGVLIYPKKDIDFNIKGKNILFSFDGKEMSVLVQGAVQSAGNSMAWWMNDILKSNDFSKEYGDIDIDKLGENALLFYPHLVGDKTIYADSTLMGAFLGLQTSTTRKEMNLAIMEGISMAVKQLSEVMRIPREELEGLRITGGGSKNDVWMQIMADVLNVPVQQLESGAGAGYGMALTAVASCNAKLSLENMIDQTVGVKRVFTPRKYNSALYQKKYEKYLKVYEAMKLIYED